MQSFFGIQQLAQIFCFVARRQTTNTHTIPGFSIDLAFNNITLVAFRSKPLRRRVRNIFIRCRGDLYRPWLLSVSSAVLRRRRCWPRRWRRVRNFGFYRHRCGFAVNRIFGRRYFRISFRRGIDRWLVTKRSVDRHSRQRFFVNRILNILTGKNSEIKGDARANDKHYR